MQMNSGLNGVCESSAINDLAATFSDVGAKAKFALYWQAAIISKRIEIERA